MQDHPDVIVVFTHHPARLLGKILYRFGK
jgi:hypothetical protein